LQSDSQASPVNVDPASNPKQKILTATIVAINPSISRFLSAMRLVLLECYYPKSL
jgi:hypothetical protein